MPAADRINLRVTPEDLAEIDAAAEAAGETRSEFMITATRGRARGELDEITPRQALDVLARTLGLWGSGLYGALVVVRDRT